MFATGGNGWQVSSITCLVIKTDTSKELFLPFRCFKHCYIRNKCFWYLYVSITSLSQLIITHVSFTVKQKSCIKYQVIMWLTAWKLESPAHLQLFDWLHGRPITSATCLFLCQIHQDGHIIDNNDPPYIFIKNKQLTLYEDGWLIKSGTNL